MDSSFILNQLSKRFGHNPFWITEAFVYPEESDFLMVTRADITHEIEVKISRSDFQADFKKRKHKRFQGVINGDKFITIPGPERNAVCSISQMLKNWQYQKELAEKYGKEGFVRNIRPPHSREWYCEVYFQEVSIRPLPNKFSFAVPEGMISKDEVPHYAGLYYVKEDGTTKEIKRAKKIHKEKFTRWKHLASKYYWKWKLK